MDLIEKTRAGLIKLAKGTGWETIFNNVVYSIQFEDLIKGLENIVMVEEDRFTPSLKDVFSNIINVPYEKLEYVCVFDNKNSPSLKQRAEPLYQENQNKAHAAQQRYLGAMLNKPDLSDIIQDGVLFMYISPTKQLSNYRINHRHLWVPFFRLFFEYLNDEKPELHYIDIVYENSIDIIDVTDDNYTLIDSPKMIIATLTKLSRKKNKNINYFRHVTIK